MSTAFQPNAFQGTGFQIAGGVAATQLEVTIGITQDSDSVSVNLNLPAPFTGAGNPARDKKRRKILVEIDKETFEVKTEEEAVALLEFAAQEAQKQADLVIQRAKKAIKRPTRKVLADARKALPKPEIHSSVLPDLAEQISRQIEEIYRNALITVEIDALLKKEEENDDEEALLMLL